MESGHPQEGYLWIAGQFVAEPRTALQSKEKMIFPLLLQAYCRLCLQTLLCEQSSFNLTTQPIAHQNALNAVDRLSTFEKDNSGNNIDIPLAGEFPILIHIQLGKHHAPLVLLADRLKFWVLYLACTTLRCRKVDNHHLRCIQNLFSEILACYINIAVRHDVL